jgi:hypothetical protein
MLVDTVDEAQRWIQAGVQIIAYSSDVAVLRGAYASAVRSLRSSASPLNSEARSAERASEVF